MLYFFLGNTPDLSLLELQSLAGDSFAKLREGIVTSSPAVDLASLDRLGGTRKVASFLSVCPPQDLLAQLTQTITADSAKNVAVTDYAGTKLTPAELIGIKDSVRKLRPLRFVSTTTGEHELLMLAHQHVSEFNLLPHASGIAIAKTIWIFDAESWVKRDRQKPYRDIKRGMLPPKLARIMVNLATRGEPLSLLDPFCGTGTILTEALLSGCRVVGSDTDERAVRGAGENCAWVARSADLPSPQFKLLVSDASHVSGQVKAVDAIASELYMGPLIDDRHLPSLDKLKNIAKGLDKLYRGALKDWRRILPSRGRVVITLPRFVVYNRVIESISIDTLTGLGYNYVSSAAYGKPGAAVIRHITILEKT